MPSGKRAGETRGQTKKGGKQKQSLTTEAASQGTSSFSLDGSSGKLPTPRKSKTIRKTGSTSISESILTHFSPIATRLRSTSDNMNETENSYRSRRNGKFRRPLIPAEPITDWIIIIINRWRSLGHQRETNRNGVALLFNSNFEYKVHSVARDTDGCFIITDILKWWTSALHLLMYMAPVLETIQAFLKEYFKK